MEEKEELSFPYVLRYVSGNLMKISHKLTESYVISRIWHRLGRADVLFVFQQKVLRENDKYALTDLYLPQLGIVVEVNEPFHYKERKKIEDDNQRNEEVARVANAVVFKVDCRENIEGIHRQIDEIVCKIEKKIAELGKEFIPWNESWLTPSYHKSKGILRVGDNPCVRTIDEIAEIFDTKVQHRGFLRKGDAPVPNKKDTFVWWPNEKNKQWHNEYYTEGEEAFIREYPDDKSKVEEHMREWLAKDVTRITFLRYKDALSIEMYRFIGVFKIDKALSQSKRMCIWRRISDSYKLGK